MALTDDEAADYIEAGGAILGGIISIFSPPAGVVVTAGGKVAGKIYRDEKKVDRKIESRRVNSQNPLENEKDDAPIPSLQSDTVEIEEGALEQITGSSGSIFRLANSIF